MERSSTATRTVHGGFNIDKLHQEAHARWLKPAEVLFILENHERSPFTPEAPQKPASGSLFLFNRRVLRYFRKDGHAWRKKKDGRTVGEAHERLKVGNIDALNCYYAHGEQNPYFQRRSYWMLDPAYDHIVLVHYREVAEGRYVSGSLSNSTAQSPPFSQSTSINKAHVQSFTSGMDELHQVYQSASSPASLEEVDSRFVIDRYETGYLNGTVSSGNYTSPQPEVDQALRKLVVQLSLDNDDDGNSIYFEDPGGLGLVNHETRSAEESLDSFLCGSEYTMQLLDGPGDNEKQNIGSLGLEFSSERTQSPSWEDVLEFTSSSPETNSHVTQLPSAGREATSEKVTWQQLNNGINNTESWPNKYQNLDHDFSLQLSETRRFLLGSGNPIESPTSISRLQEAERHRTNGTATLEGNSSLMLRKENSLDWMGSIDLSIDSSIYSSNSSGVWSDPRQLGYSFRTDSSLTVAEKQLFSIREISPEWAFSFETTKVVIIGVFLCDPSEFPWRVMFGNVEVPLEIVQKGVLRCQTPPLSAGKVTLCITSGNRESCSEIREFQFCVMPNTSSSVSTSPQVKASRTTEELLLLAKFVQFLLCGYDCPEGCTQRKNKCYGESQTTDNRLQQIIEALSHGSEPPLDTVDRILQESLKDKLQQRLLSIYQANGGKDCLLSKQEQGIIHMISGLGYEWALNPILNSGVGVNFRDANGWTALHWAARFGREKMVAALLAAGSSAGAVTDPTPQDPIGKTPGAISSASGHKGLAGYLSEVALTSHLFSLTMEESEISKVSAAMEAERAVESISRSVQTHTNETEDELSLKDSLAAVRNATLAATRIQSAFRTHSFRKRQQQASGSKDDYGMTLEDIHDLLSATKLHRSVHGPRDQKFDKAALSIQKKYRGWKGRKDFLTLQKHAVKIQAHVRGHQVRKKYKEFIWTVSVVEKAVLRWRRGKVGLRGFRSELEMIDETEDDDIAKVFRKQKVDAALDQALSRVLSMVDSPEARQQYRRMLETYRQAQA